MKQGVRVLLSLVTLVMSSTVVAANSGVTYQGRILKPDGSPLAGQFTQFKLQLRTPDSQDCLMYEEVQSQDLRNSNGAFSLTINDGNGSRIDTTGLTLDRIFANRGTFTLDPTKCSSGAGTYLPNASDGRNLVVLFKDETMSTWEPIPAQKINFVPFAFESKQVAGFTADSLLRVVNGSGDPLTGLAPLSNAQYTELMALVNGTSNAFTKAGQLGGVALPTMTSGEVLGWNGSAWVSQPSVAGPNSVTTAMIQNSAVDSTKIATGAVGTSQVASNVTINTSGTIGAAITTTRDFKIFAASPSTFNIDMQAPALAASYSLVWPMNDGNAGEVLTTDGSGVMSWAPAAPASQWTTHAANISYDGVGNVGIGTTSPTVRFEVEGATNLNGLVTNEFTHTGDMTWDYGTAIWPTFNHTASAPSYGSVEGLEVWPSLGPASTGPTNYIAGTVSGLNNSGTGFLNWAISNEVYGPVTDAGSHTWQSIGMRIRPPDTQGIVDYAYGLYIQNHAGVTATNAKFNLYSQGPGLNYFGGNVGIGTTAPTAALHLKAGSSTAGTAPLKFTSGTLMTTPEDGAMEYNSGSGLWFTIGSTRYVIPTNTAAGNYSNVSTISNAAGSITMTPMAGNSVIVNQTTTSMNSSSGALIVNGGAGVAGAINAGGNITSGGSITAATNAVIPQIYGSTAANGDIRIDGTSNATAGNVYLASAGGTVGIGTTSPTSTLHVYGFVNGTRSITVESASGGGASKGILVAKNDFGNVLSMGMTSHNYVSASTAQVAEGGYLHNTGSGGLSIINGDSGSPIRFYTAGATVANERMRINAAGSVGIGTTSPSQKLEVAGNIAVQNTGQFWINGVGHLAQNSDAGLALVNFNATPITFRSNTVERMRIDATGKVGIGTSVPTEQLDVAGAIRIASSASNAAGTLRWTGTNFQGSDGTSWFNIMPNPPAAGGCDQTQVFNTPGTYGYTAPASFATITVKVWGAGGGGGFYFGTYATPGGASTISSLGLSAGGGGPGSYHTGSGTGEGLGGTATGGTINTPGNNGTVGTVSTISGTGGMAPNGGSGGSGVTIAPGQNGATPGGGGGGGSLSGTTTPTGGGSGGYTEKTYTTATLPPGTTINDIVVGAGGIGYDLGHPSRGGQGGSGQVSITCSTTGAPPVNNRAVVFQDAGAYSSSTNLVYDASGNLGVGTSTPQATLDINGTARLKKQTVAPSTCTAARDGTIALTSSHTLCICDGSAWVKSTDGVSACVW